jgi:hypothetical protein
MGLWNSPSCIAFLLAAHISHKATQTLTKSSNDKAFIIRNIKFLTSGSEISLIFSTILSSAKAQAERAIGHLIKE